MTEIRVKIPDPGYRIIKEMTSPAGAEQVLVEWSGKHYVVSSVDALFSGPETLVFRANADGEVTDWGEVAGGRGTSREEAIAELIENL